MYAIPWFLTFFAKYNTYSFDNRLLANSTLK